MRSHSLALAWGLALLTVFQPDVTRAHEEAEIAVGRNAAGEIRVHPHFEPPILLEASIFPGIPGHATGELAFHSVAFDEPEEDLFQLSTAADFRLVLLAKDHGMEVWNDTGSGFLPTNGVFRVGPAPFDIHPIWNLVEGTPGQTYALTLLLRDANGIYPDSAPFQLRFALAPEVQHRLSLLPVDSQTAKLSWPTNAVDWEPQWNDAPIATAWQTLTNPPAVDGTNFSLTFPVSAPQRFFRLKREEGHH